MAIEQYFVKGVTYRWAVTGPITPPVMDGAIVRSGVNAPPALTVTGLDADIKYGTQAYGLTMNYVIPHRWLHYVLGRTAFVGSVTTDVLTGFMSGCRICSWTEGGHRRVGHIGTVSLATADQPPNTTVKTAFCNSPAGQAGSHLKGYNPALAWSFDEISRVTKESKNPGSLAPRILSLVTATNDFYSILMMQKMGTNDWVCGGKKKVHGSHRATILAELA